MNDLDDLLLGGREVGVGSRQYKSMAWQILGSFFSHYKFSCIPTLYKSPIMKKMELKIVSSIVRFRHFPLNFNRYCRGHKIRVRRELAVQDHFGAQVTK